VIEKALKRLLAGGIRVWWMASVAVFALAGCSVTRHVPDGEMLLDHSRIALAPGSEVTSQELTNYLRQKPNARTLGIAPMRLHTYSLSGRDSTRWYNRWLRRLGEPPVIYSQRLTDASARQLQLALVNRGYMSPTVAVDTVHRSPKKIDVVYRVAPGTAHKIASVRTVCADSVVAGFIAGDWDETLLKPGENLDMTLLDAERTRITNSLQQDGYYAFAKDKISFTADTVSGSHDVALTLNVAGTDNHRYIVRRVIFQPDYDPAMTPEQAERLDTVACGSIYVIEDPEAGRSYISPKMLAQNNWITPGAPYNSAEFNRTYEALGRLGIVRSTSVALQPAGEYAMDAVVRLTRNPLQGVSVELEGTNSEGDLGAGVGVTYQHRNLFRGSETLTLKARGSYESLSGNLEGLINNHYTEASAEVALTLPKFSAPFLSRNYKRKMLASTEFSINGNYQERPEYTRVIAGAGWRYKWNNRRNNNRRIFDLLDISYVFLPRSTINFLDEVAGGNPLLRYSYENHFIMRMGYSTFLTNKRVISPASSSFHSSLPKVSWYTCSSTSALQKRSTRYSLGSKSTITPPKSNTMFLYIARTSIFMVCFSNGFQRPV